MARKTASSNSVLLEPPISLLCDGVRKEITGQETLVGVYAERFNTEIFPVNFMPTVYIRIKFKLGGIYQTQMRVTQNRTTNLLPPVTFPITAEKTGITTVVIGPIPLIVQSPGKVYFSAKIQDEDFQDLCYLDFVRGEFQPITVKQGQSATS